MATFRAWWVFVVWAISALLAPIGIDKPRKPRTAGEQMLSTIVGLPIGYLAAHALVWL